MENEITGFDKILDLSGKSSIVTGGAMGIGLGIVARLAQAKSSVLIADLDEEKAKEESEKLNSQGFKTAFIKADVSNEEDVSQMTEKVISEFGGIDILVNNAGIYPQIPLSKMATHDFDRVIAVNLRGVFLTTQIASKRMITQGRGGKIINITSIDALHPSMVGLAHYDASKHGVWGFTKNAALELAEHKISVNAIAPGGIATPGVSKMPNDPNIDIKKIMEEFLQRIPMHRMGTADEIGKVALFLASDMSSYITGEQIVVDGGVLLR